MDQEGTHRKAVDDKRMVPPGYVFTPHRTTGIPLPSGKKVWDDDFTLRLATGPSCGKITGADRE